MKPEARLTAGRAGTSCWRSAIRREDSIRRRHFCRVVSKSAWHAIGEQVVAVTCVYKTLSETGQVKLTSRDWLAEPVVEFNLLSTGATSSA